MWSIVASAGGEVDVLGRDLGELDLDIYTWRNVIAEGAASTEQPPLCDLCVLRGELSGLALRHSSVDGCVARGVRRGEHESANQSRPHL